MTKKRISLFMFMVVFAVIICMGNAITEAYAETYDDFEYTKTDDGITITKYTGSALEVDIPDEIDGASVVAIGDSAFYLHNKIISVDIPETVTVIDDGAFRECTALKNVNFPEGLIYIGEHAFHKCIELKDISIPAGVKNIETYAFYGCGLTGVEIPEGVESIGSYAFCLNEQMTSVKFPSTLKEIKASAFDNDDKLKEVSIPENVKAIGNYAFGDCWELESVVFPDGLEKLGAGAFFDCYILGEIELPDSIISIGDNCFYQCYKLKLSELPFELRTLGNSAFYDCNELTEIYFPPFVESVGDDAFFGTGNLKDVYIMDRYHYDEVIKWGWGESRPTNKDITKAHEVYCLSKIAFDDPGFEYDGAEHTIIPVCSKVPAEDMIYPELKVTEPGTYEITVKANNKKTCYGEKTLIFKVSKKMIEEGEVTITGLKDVTYTGKLQKQDLMIMMGEKELANGTDYKVYYDNNLGAGTAQIAIIFRGNYTGSIEGLTFKIKPALAINNNTASAKNLKVSLKYTKLTHTGKARKPAVIVKDEKGNIIDKSQYSVKYKNNTNIGKATATVTFKGNYTGTKSLKFTIRPAATKITKVTAAKKGFTVKWGKKKYSGYEVRYSLKSSMSKAKTVKAGKTKTSKKITKLKSKKKYYVQVRTYKIVGGKKYYSSWSSKKSIRTK